MDREDIKEVLKKIETAPNTFGVVGSESTKAVNAFGKSVPITWFEQFTEFVREDTLKEVLGRFDKAEEEEPGADWRSGHPSLLIKGMLNS